MKNLTCDIPKQHHPCTTFRILLISTVLEYKRTDSPHLSFEIQSATFGIATNISVMFYLMFNISAYKEPFFRIDPHHLSSSLVSISIIFIAFIVGHFPTRSFVMHLALEECSDQSTFSRVVDCEWAGYYNPYHTFMQVLFPVFGGSPESRAAAI